MYNFTDDEILVIKIALACTVAVCLEQLVMDKLKDDDVMDVFIRLTEKLL